MRTRAIVMMASLVMLAGCRESKQTVPLVHTCVVSADKAGETAVYPGRSTADANSNLAFRVYGTISSILVKPGDVVRKGQVVAELDRRDYQTQLNATEAEYRQVKAEVERVMAMYGDDAVTANDYDKARYGLARMEQKLSRDRDLLEDCTLRAPFSGCIEEVFFHQGETVMAGVPVISMFNNGKTGIVITITAEDFRRKDEIESATASFSSIGKTEFPLAVRNTLHRANANQMYEMHLAMARDTSAVTPGMTALVTLNFKAKDDNGEYLVPANAIFHKDGEERVFVVIDSTNRLCSRTVGVIRMNNDGSALVKGLEIGETVVAAGVNRLTEGLEVRKVAGKSDTNPGGLL